MESFFKLKRPDEVLGLMEVFGPSGEEVVPTEDALGRVVSREVTAPENLPGFFRSAMDGYAVRARDTFGATESLPALLEVVGEVLMGQMPEVDVQEGQAVRISTGGMIPEGADGVEMVEYCHQLDENTVEVSRPVSPLENIIQPADDFEKGATVLTRGQRLRPQDLGVLAGLGKTGVSVYSKARAAIISTGDEVVSMDATLRPGQVRDINRYTLSSFCRKLGAAPLCLGLCPDRFEPLKEMVGEALGQADTVWISGGSSVGTRDLTLRVFESLPHFELLVHGISISPGKPTIIGRSGPKAVIGLPGHVASAMVVAEVFLAPLILRLSGQQGFKQGYRHFEEAELTRNVESVSGREDYIRAKLTRDGEKVLAEPIFGKSGLISTLVQADGLIRVDMNREGLYQGERVKVMLFSPFDGGLF
jgi:molybdopterin molybdotransferase